MTVNAGRYTLLGVVPPNTPVTVTSSGSMATLYADKSSGTTIVNPVVTDEFGALQFFGVPGDVTLSWAQGTAERSVTVTVAADPTEAWPG